MSHRPHHVLLRARRTVVEDSFGRQLGAPVGDHLGQVVLHFAAGLVEQNLLRRGDRAAQSLIRSPIESISESTMQAASLAYSSMNADRASAGHHVGIGSWAVYTAVMAASSSAASITSRTVAV
ncbi:hypothetical protein [Mycolicibacterium rhodesiae]|uniref:hypothetical protein n=1 Tax=Mycolicibacterium rhodesiae TaxID=36814 RepID=UPI0013FD7A45|nr:hypothetical protein [Mycolicibacterium rhodesiae]MCV7343000.1 hypothetical protein [Mycolicibacterium rhodesiae]